MNTQSESTISTGTKQWKDYTPTEWVYLAVKFVIGLGIALLLGRLLTVWISYSVLFDNTVRILGVDEMYARPIAVALTGASLIVVPWALWYFVFGLKKAQLFVSVLAGSLILAAASYFSNDVLFDRTTGEAMRCYAKTLQGFKLSSSCDFDPQLGVRFQKITPAVAREIATWKATGKQGDLPRLESGKYFNPITGEAKSWYAIRPNGKLFISPLPGYDEMTGEQLLPMTKEIVEKYLLSVDKSEEVVSAYRPTGLGQLSTVEGCSDLRGHLDHLASLRKEFNELPWEERQPPKAGFLWVDPKPGVYSQRAAEIRDEAGALDSTVRALLLSCVRSAQVESKSYEYRDGIVYVSGVAQVGPFTVVEVTFSTNTVFQIFDFSMQVFNTSDERAEDVHRSWLKQEGESFFYPHWENVYVHLDSHRESRAALVVKDPKGRLLAEGTLLVGHHKLKFKADDSSG